MSMDTDFKIDLNSYGVEGEIIVAPPTFRRTIEMKNAMSRSARLVKGEGDISVEDIPTGDLEILGMLAYIESAPFNRTKESFLQFCDKVDSIRRGSADELFDKISEYIIAIDRGDGSPFVDSADAETASSD